MQAVIREKALTVLAEVPALVDAYQSLDSRFIPSAQQWLSEAEKQLGPHRLASVSRLASLRGLIAASGDGYCDEAVERASTRSTRKQQRATVMRIVQEAEELLRTEVVRIDSRFDELRDKLSQLLAVASSKQPLDIQSPLTEPVLDRLWQQALSLQDNPTLGFYLQAQLSDVDRRYLLQDLASRLLRGAV